MLKSYLHKSLREAGVDEAGRGCLAGPVVAATVILPPSFKNKFINDSKKLSAKDRMELRELIKDNALAWAIGMADHNEIDKINILNATYLAMHRAIDKLKPKPAHLIIDGNRFKPYSDKTKNIPHSCIVKGDGKFLSIAAASILAKTERDLLMDDLHEKFPEYNWLQNKGYGTLFHRNAIARHGYSPFHRMSFHLKDQQLTLDLS